MANLLLLSNSTMPRTSFFSWPKPWVKEFLPPDIREVVFIPFAAVSLSYDAYFEAVSKAFADMGLGVKSLHDDSDKVAIVRNAQAIVVGGGNTFALLSRMYAYNLVGVVQSRVAEGASYIGWSAGANLGCPTIKTTNDMPVEMPPSMDALDLVPFQINPHYHELKFENQGGETRRERLEEFLVLNPDKKVIGLPEGMLLIRRGDRLILEGEEGTAKLFTSGQPVKEFSRGSDLSFLLESAPD
jgi:dipeptidase E